MSSIPEGYCQCGCGEKTRIPGNNDRSKGWIKGKPLRFITGHNLAKGAEHNRYNGGLTYNKIRNRWYVVCRDYTQVPFARVVMEARLKRELRSEEIVHHKDEDSTNDDPTNLEIHIGHGMHSAIAHYGYTKEFLLEKLRNHYKKTGALPTRNDFEQTRPNGKTYHNRFGSFRQALKEAGLL